MSKTSILSVAALAAALGFGAIGAASFAHAEMTVMVGGAAMYPSKNIVENAVNSKDHTTLVAAVKAAGLVDTLASPGPFTVLAPTNEAFAALPAGTVDNLLKPDMKGALTGVLTYHVISGTMTEKDIMAKIAEMGGKYTVKTVNGGDVTFMKSGSGVSVTDAKGDVAEITIPDVMQSNGVIQVINKVLLPAG